MKRFLGIGECMVELAQIAPQTYRRGFAGDTFNAAWYARRILGDAWDVSYMSAVGEDAASGEMLAFMRAGGIGTQAMRTIKGRTVGLYMIDTKGGERSFSYWRESAAARMLADDMDFLARQVERADILHFSGITLAILPPERRVELCDLLCQARGRGALVSFDTNLRPRLWASTDEMAAGLTMGAAAASHVLPSFDEESGLFGDKTPEETIERYRAGGAPCVLCKNGAAPLEGYSEETGRFSIAPRPVARVVDSTAAGDSFAGALMAHLGQGAALRAAAGHAMDIARHVIQHPGALVDSFDDKGETQ